QMLEGLIVEGYFSQFISELVAHGICSLPVTLVKSLNKGTDGKWSKPAWWLWQYINQPNYDVEQLTNILMQESYHVLRCTYDQAQKDFILRSWGTKQIERSAQGFMMEKRRMTEIKYQPPEDIVSDDERYMEAFWGGLQGVYGESLFKKVVLPRLFKNCVISPFFSAVWDVDNIVRMDSGEFMQFEVKHKYPFEKDGKLFFGINKGQLNVMSDLADCGISTLHMILIKPKWTDVLSPNYLLQDPLMRKNVFVVACKLDREALRNLKNAKGGTSGHKTSFSGRTNLSYVSIPIERFKIIGTLDDSLSQLVENIALAAKGSLTKSLNKSILNSARVSI
ncbi:hypothetical protein QWY20_17580, partial [Alkalimonas sp. MEB108]|nr:hypothetical protein [Alkalimonas sp. MEB108]